MFAAHPCPRRGRDSDRLAALRYVSRGGAPQPDGAPIPAVLGLNLRLSPEFKVDEKFVFSRAMNYVPGEEISASQPDDALHPGTRVGVLLKERNDGNAYLMMPAGVIVTAPFESMLQVITVSLYVED